MWIRNNRVVYQADDGAGSGAAGDAGAAGEQNAGDGGGAQSQVTFTAEQQVAMDKIIEGRLARDRKQTRTTVEKEFIDKAAQAAMTEGEKLKAEKDAAVAKSAELDAKTNQRIINSEARVQAVEASVKADKVSYVLKLADLSGIEMGDDGEPDAKSIKAAIEAVKTSVPELFGQITTPKAGGDFSGGNAGAGAITEESIRKMSTSELAANMPAVEAFYKSRH